MKQNLTGKLRAIQDIKSQYYVGTQEALRAIKDSEGVYTEQEDFSKKLNQKLKDEIGELSYEATPERIFGLEDMIHESIFQVDFFDLSSEEQDTLINMDYINYVNGKLPLLNIPIYDFKEEGMDVFFPVFSRANLNYVSSDLQFKQDVLNSIEETHSDVLNEFDETPLSYPADKYFKCLIKRLEEKNWEEELSKENLKTSQHAKSMNEYYANLRGVEIFKRTINDRYDHRLEFRRQLLGKYLQDFSGAGYEEVVESVENLIDLRENTFKKLKRFGNPGLLSKQKDLVDYGKFIRHLLGSEKSFAIKFLKS